jgi:hypothetical protein
MELDAWLEPFRRFWAPHLDALERHLDRMEQTSRKGRKRGVVVRITRLAPRTEPGSRRRERSGRSFSSATCTILPQRSGRRLRTPSNSASGRPSILTGTSAPLAR